VNERRKPDRGGKVARSVAGAACECGRSTCRYRRRSGPGRPSLLTQGRWKRSWLLASSRLVREGAGRDRERQRSGHQRRSRPKKPDRGGLIKINGARLLINPQGLTRKVIEQAEAGGTSSNVTPLEAGLPQGGAAPRSRRHSGLNPSEALCGGGLCGASRGLES